MHGDALFRRPKFTGRRHNSMKSLSQADMQGEVKVLLHDGGEVGRQPRRTQGARRGDAIRGGASRLLR